MDHKQFKKKINSILKKLAQSEHGNLLFCLAKRNLRFSMTGFRCFVQQVWVPEGARGKEARGRKYLL